MDTQGGTAMTPVYQTQTKTLDQQIAVLQKELRDPQLTERERKETNEALKIAQGQRDVYARATRARQKHSTAARAARTTTRRPQAHWAQR